MLSEAGWNQQQELSPADGATDDQFGSSVSVSGDTAVIGSRLHGGTGAAYVFVRDGTTWTQQAELNGSDSNASDYFGYSVAVSGGTAVVGARRHEVGSNADQGAAYVFVRSGSLWSQQELSEGTGGAANDYFGTSVSVSGATALIGSNGFNSAKGTAYVYVQNSGVWTLQQQLSATDGASSDSFGNSVSVSGGTALIGAPAHKVNTYIHQGAAYVFVQSGVTWSLQQELTASDGLRYDAFGNSVSVSGGAALIGATGRAVGGNTNQGAAYVFLQSGGVWSQQPDLTASDGAASDQFGSTVAISGGVAAVGASLHATSGNLDQGAAYLFSPPASLSISTTHSSPIFQSGPGTITLTVANTGGPTAGTATVSDTLDSGFTVNSADSGCSVSGQAATCTIAAGSAAASTAFGTYVTAASNAGTSISNTATLADMTDAIATASASDTIIVSAQAPQVDSSLTQTMLSGSTDNGTCASGNMTLTATDLLRNTSGSTLTNPYAVIGTLSGGNTLLSQSASSASVANGTNVTFTFHILLNTCGTFQLLFDVQSN